jgi:hypothetical protein
MTDSRTLDLAWLALIALTLGAAALGHGAQAGLPITLAIALLTAIKGRLVIDRFMELGGANPAIRRLVRVYGLMVPALMVAVQLLGPQLAALTAL